MKIKMDHKKSPKGKKRQSKQFEDTLWECSACTYRNNPEAFKCSMCGIRKGTSTRKPKLNPDMLEVQVQKHAFTPPAVSHSRVTREETSYRSEQPRPSSSASNDQGYPEDEEEPGPSTAPKAKKMKLPPVPKGKSKPGANLNGSTSGGSTPSTPSFVSTPVIGRGGRIRNLDRKSASVHSVSVDDVTITITEYKLKPPRKERKGGSGVGAAGGSADGGEAGGSASAMVNQSDGESDSQDTRTT